MVLRKVSNRSISNVIFRDNQGKVGDKVSACGYNQLQTLTKKVEAIVSKKNKSKLAETEVLRESIWQLLITIKFEHLNLSPRLRQDEILNSEIFMRREYLCDLLSKLNQKKSG